MSRELASRAARAFDRANVPILKAHVLGAMPDSNARSSVDENERLFVEAGAIVPPYDPEALCLLLENSNSLRQNIDAYVTNIDAFGHRFEPVIDLDADDANQRIANAIYVERLAAKEAERDDPIVQEKPLVPTAAEIAARKKEVAETIRMERSRLDTFFDFCCVDLSFVTLRRRTRQDIETLGNGYWEVLRNASGEIVQFGYVPGFTMRLLRLDPEPVHVDMKVKVSDLAFDAVTVPRRFRRYVQILETQVVYFKEFGDPRILSRKTGELVSSVEELRGRDPSDGPATEILHFKLHNPRSAYGTPRWIGNLLAVLGSRQTEEINFLYFENKSVPPLALLVSGGRLSKSSIPRIEDFIENHIKGKRNFFKVLVLEAEPAQGAPEFAHSGRMRIELKPLTSAQQQDELFGSYDERNIDKVGQAFRLPRLLRGDIRDFNRSTADAALHFSETQIFQPERDEFDFLINRKLLSDMGIGFWRFRSNAPLTRDPSAMTEMVVALVKAGVVTPEEGRHLAGDIFNRDFKKIAAEWVKQPIALTLAGFAAADDPQSAMVGPTEGETGTPKERALPAEAKRLIALRDTLRRESEKRAPPEREVIRVPAADFASWFEESDAA
ncbi:MAG: phage portal protein [Deltaproteobacteria bacterium]